MSPREGRAGVAAPAGVAGTGAVALDTSKSIAAAPAPSALLAPEPLDDPTRDDKLAAASPLRLDDVNDVGPAAPASAFADGVVLLARNDELVVCRLKEAASKSAKPAPSRVEPATQSAATFLPVARGPAVGRSHAYWTSKGRLVRRALSGGDLEVLAADARSGTRVAVAGWPEAVAYISQPAAGQEPKAKLRLSDGRALELTPDGAAASSVSLASVGDDLVASYIDGRSGMTPVHARKFRPGTGALDPDVVVWVAGATQAQTELTSTGSGAGAWLLIPVERDASTFGLASLALGVDPAMDPPVSWRVFQNGLDLAPAAGQHVCGVPMALYVRPSNARPGSPQELVLSALTPAESTSFEVVARARGFADVSIQARPGGALLAYVADNRTWARLIRCKT